MLVEGETRVDIYCCLWNLITHLKIGNSKNWILLYNFPRIMWNCHKCGKPVFFGRINTSFKSTELCIYVTLEQDKLNIFLQLKGSSQWDLISILIVWNAKNVVKYWNKDSMLKYASFHFPWYMISDFYVNLSQHKGVPYCHVPCYGALFGPQLFGHGTRVESHKSFGKIENKTYCGITR